METYRETWCPVPVSGLMNKHIVKHIVKPLGLTGLMETNKTWSLGVNAYFWMPCARLSPD